MCQPAYTNRDDNCELARPSDYRDLAIEMFADSEAALLAQIADLEWLLEEALCDAESYRWLVQRVLDEWHGFIQRTEAIREENTRLQRHIEHSLSEVLT